MASDIDKLVQYQERATELNELNKKFDQFESFEDVEITIPPGTIITVTRTNKSGNRENIDRFAFSTIQHFGELARKAIDYRKEKHGEKRKHEAKE